MPKRLGIIDETPLLTGYGYKIKNVASDDDLDELAGPFIQESKLHIDWVIQQFGTQSASDLELDSTIVFVDREASEVGKQLSGDHLAQQVRDVKPHFSESKIRRHVQALKDKLLLVALAP